jgi:hypothetical protein
VRAAMRVLLRFIDRDPHPADPRALVPDGVPTPLPEDERAGVPGARRVQTAAQGFSAAHGPDRVPATEVRQAEDRLRRGVRRMSDTIRQHGGPWFLQDLTLADIAIMPVLIRIWMKRSALPLVLGVYGRVKVAQAEHPAGRAEQARDVARAVVGHHALDPDAQTLEPARRPDQEARDRLALLVGQDRDEGEPAATSKPGRAIWSISTSRSSPASPSLAIASPGPGAAITTASVGSSSTSASTTSRTSQPRARCPGRSIAVKAESCAPPIGDAFLHEQSIPAIDPLWPIR